MGGTYGMGERLPSYALPVVTFSFAACLVFSSIQSSWSRDTSKAARISLIISSAWRGEGLKPLCLPQPHRQGQGGQDATSLGLGVPFPCSMPSSPGGWWGKEGFLWVVIARGWGQKCPHNGLAVPVEGGFDKEGAQGEAQRVIRVGDAGLPAGRAGLQE